MPNGNTARIRQTLIGDVGVREVRLLLNQAGLAVGDLDQFPSRIEIQQGAGNYIPFVRKDPVEIASFGQGIGQDYVSETNLPLFNNSLYRVRIYYGEEPPDEDPFVDLVMLLI